MNPKPAASDALLKALGNPGGELNVADVGCGAGARCRLWASHGHQVYGADRDAEAIALARRHAHQDGLPMLLDVASACALPWPDRSMDVCMAFDVLESSADWRACVAECLRVLRPGGALYISIAPASPIARQLPRELARHGARWRGMPGSRLAPLRWLVHAITPAPILLAFKPAA
jgi:2-polyprenyl-3-methyl-5-hydroxy-6-metoxy-1,4-benzoquinol methylase